MVVAVQGRLSSPCIHPRTVSTAPRAALVVRMSVVDVVRRRCFGCVAPVDYLQSLDWLVRGSRGIAVAAALRCGTAMGSMSVQMADTVLGTVLDTQLAAAGNAVPLPKSVTGTYTPTVAPIFHLPTAAVVAAARSGGAHVLPRVCQEPRALQQVPLGWQAREPKRGKRERRGQQEGWRRRRRTG